MLPTLLLSILALTLLLLARRGRRIDDHPLCRTCRFDLTGLPPTSQNCPECGRDIRSPAAVRIGHRQPIRPLLLTAWLLLLPSLAAFVLLLTLSLTRTPIVRYEPLFVLRWNLRTPSLSAEALTEITRRLDAGTLSEPALAPVLDDLLALQADRSRPWNDAYGELILDAAEHSLCSPARSPSRRPPAGLLVSLSPHLGSPVRPRRRSRTQTPPRTRLRLPRRPLWTGRTSQIA